MKRKITTGITKFVCVALVFSFITSNLFADASIKTRKNCKTSKRYVAKAKIRHHDSQTDNGCTWAKATVSKYSGSTEIAYAAAYCGNSGGNYAFARTTSSYYKADAGYFVDDNATSDTEAEAVDGYASSSFSSPVVKLVGDKNGVITIQNLDINLAAATNSLFGSIYRIIVWKPNDQIDPVTGEVITDEDVSLDKILWEASIRIEYGQVIATGGLKAEDFSVSYSDQTITATLDGSQKTIRIMNAVSRERLQREGMALNIDRDIRQPLLRDNPRKVPIETITGATADNIEVFIQVSDGYGTYREIYAPTSGSVSAKTDNSQQLNAASNNLNEVAFNNYPQPFTDNTTIEFSVPETQNATVDIFNIDGKMVQVIFNGVANKEENYHINFNAGNLPRGLYICKFKGEKQTATIKLMIVR